MEIKTEPGKRSYGISLEKGSLEETGNYVNLKRRVLIVTDENIPRDYIEKLKRQCEKPFIYVAAPGEGSKSIAVAEKILQFMLENNFTREDCVAALGGGVVGDLAGFVASLYMRGIDFINIPTTLLSQVDSSIGGKTGVNLGNVKNIVGSFYQPKAVITDPVLLDSLSHRQFLNGFAEVVKMAMVQDRELFDFVENKNMEEIKKNIEFIIQKSLMIKKRVVEEDEKEKGLRRILNFGHTIGHGIEVSSKGKIFHGEAVAVGMKYVSRGEARDKYLRIYNRLYKDIDESIVKKDDILRALIHDKKSTEEGGINVVLCDKIGSWEIKRMLPREIMALMD